MCPHDPRERLDSESSGDNLLWPWPLTDLVMKGHLEVFRIWVVRLMDSQCGTLEHHMVLTHL